MKQLANTLKTLALGAAIGVALASSPADAAGGRMIFATQESGTMYYTLGTGFSKMLSDQLQRRVTIQPYSGSSVYLPLLDNGEAALGFSSSLDANAAFTGEGREALKKLRAVARVWPLKVAFMVRADSGIKTLADLKGKRVTVELKGQAAMGKVTRAMLAAGGLTIDDVVNVAVANVGAGSKALIEGNVDAAFIAVGIPLVKQAHAAIPGGVAYVDMSGPNTNAQFLGQQAAGVYSAEIAPAKNLPEVKSKIVSAAFDIFLLTGAGTPDADVEAVLGALTAQFGALQKAYPPLRRGRAEKFSMPTNTVPYHPGSVAFFKKSGLWGEANDKMEMGFK